MKAILSKVDELLKLFKAGVAQYDKLAKEGTDKITTRSVELTSKAEELAEREAKIKSIENVVTLRDQVAKDKDELDSALKTFKADKASWTTKYNAENQAIKTMKDEAVINFNKSKNELIMIQKEWDGLKKEQETWKEKYIKDLTAKLGK